MMNELDKLILGAAAAMVVMHLIGPAAIWGITRTVAECLLVIPVLIWAL
ncbi:hypothetical protein [Desulfomonile tiedjei]|uniref:Uncharacterized protein n=1 Tax=Desulfomonile tiedjei (strain ATCC 49306 / DSM 6799 / DCB-1) TaxID=706587 RepID=I4C919_DESTA|nr:hypothetical protein [Desulfomonile tiedjei]AFM26060.1 hypothetical protein Desti_3406 [Desulfomonile tiedjei DSM 6799]